MPMFLIAAVALATALSPTRATAAVQATATIRVLRAVALKLDGSVNADAPAPRDSIVKFADGSIQRVKVIEFE